MESKEYSSLFALVDSHLSKTSLKENVSSENRKSALPIPCPKGFHNGSVSETFLLSPDQRLPIPSLSVSDSPITSVLAKQVANMLKAKEKKKQKEEEKQKLEEEMKKMKLDDNEDYVIDLMKALQTPCIPIASSHSEELRSKSSSFETLFQLNFTDFDEESQEEIKPEPLLPCVTDMSFILQQKIPRGKCSPFGKVLTSRLRPVAAPYLKEKVKTDIGIFDFSTKSPCDIIKEKLRKPTSYNI
ncbi:unnamed protein product [Parnassius apollo]|uniref:(apollo) hypothetical protein n=1 Tax=Parnassius apollo TaxID=110799 RepID=A0A8S3X7H5_PARAO|nr:unnamed protein product [Parnassius apollo]